MNRNDKGHSIWLSFFDLMLEDDYLFKDIRVNDICERAKCHRSTFYRHFEDKYDLLTYGLEVLWQAYFEIENVKKVCQPFQTASSFYQNSQGRILISKHVLDDSFIDTVNLFFINKMKCWTLEVLKKEKSYSLPTDLVVHFIIGTIEVVEKWGRDQKETVTPEELDDYYAQLVLKNLDLDLRE